MKWRPIIQYTRGRYYYLLDQRFYFGDPGGGTRVKVKHEGAFPSRFDWQCPECKRWNRYFETTCECSQKEEA